MIFSIQRYLEDYIAKAGLSDPDQYAINLAQLYDSTRREKSDAMFLNAMHRVRTIFFRKNNQLQRGAFERKLLTLLDNKFKKKSAVSAPPKVIKRVEAAGKRLTKLPRISIRRFLEEFKNTIESEAVNAFWESRKAVRLRKRAEKLGQDILGVFARAKLAQRGAAIREGASGVGFVDVLITFSSGLLHVVELKMLTDKGKPGKGQLRTYMTQKRRNEGWLVYFDARKSTQKTSIPPSIKSGSATIRTIVVDINPVPPHLLG